MDFRVDLGVDISVLLVLLLISPGVRMPDFPAKPLCASLLLNYALKFQKGACFFAETYV
jgi:hypothetical protein